MGKTSSYRDSLLEALTDPKEAAAYLNAGLEDSIEAFLKAAKNVAQAHQMSKVAKGAGVQRETLYRSLSEQGNPTLNTLSSVLKVMGLRFTIEEIGSGMPGVKPSVSVKTFSPAQGAAEEVQASSR